MMLTAKRLLPEINRNRFEKGKAKKEARESVSILYFYTLLINWMDFIKEEEIERKSKYLHTHTKYIHKKMNNLNVNESTDKFMSKYKYAR